MVLPTVRWKPLVEGVVDRCTTDFIFTQGKTLAEVQATLLEELGVTSHTLTLGQGLTEMIPEVQAALDASPELSAAGRKPGVMGAMSTAALEDNLAAGWRPGMDTSLTYQERRAGLRAGQGQSAEGVL